jgi:hypothetical protein
MAANFLCVLLMFILVDNNIFLIYNDTILILFYAVLITAITKNVLWLVV